jgi:organic radical activating enzyme
MSLKISEIFYSLQGEGARQGEPSIFIRLQGCSAKHACFASGVVCDTEFESGSSFSHQEIITRIRVLTQECGWIIWTGGEPADQLVDMDVAIFHTAGYKQAIETSGVKKPPAGLDWVVLSPKVAEHAILKIWPLRPDGLHCDELRVVRHIGQSIPQTEIKAKRYFISPHFDGITPNQANITHCINLCLNNPTWNLSIQNHKLLRIL